MGTIPTIPTFTAGQVLTAAELNNMKDVADFWALTPRCFAYSGVPQTLTTGVFAAINFNEEVYDVVQSGDSPSHDTATNNTRIYIRTAGKYEIGAQIEFASNASGNRQTMVRLNAAGSYTGGTLLAVNYQSPASGVSTSCAIPTTEFDFGVGDYIEVFAYQSSGGNLNTVTGAAGVTFLRTKLTGS